MPRRFRLVLLLCSAVLLAACASGAPSASGSAVLPAPAAVARPAVVSNERQFQTPSGDVSMAKIETSAGTIEVVLYPDIAPLAVENFLALAREGYYAGSAFHRAVAGFVIQGGANPAGGADQSSFGAPFKSEWSDEVCHYPGALCMAAGDGQPDTHLSQFYIVAPAPANLDEAALQKLRDAGRREAVVESYRQAGGLPYLDYGDTVFGQVWQGMEVVDAIAASAANGSPAEAVVIQNITVEGLTFAR